jgi:hypothetical protein
VDDGDYALHTAVVNACRQRTALTERVQHELETRCAAAVRQAAQHKDGTALAAWWDTGKCSADVAGVLWAVLTHPRCDTTLERLVLNEIHMLQHQVGAQQRADVRRLAEERERSSNLGRR